MKKLILLAFLVISIGHLFAELEVDIPFDVDIVGLPFTNPYTHETDWITITNIGSTTETYTIEYTDAYVPVGWYLSVCNHESCLIPNWPAPVTLVPGEFEQIHISIQVNSTDGFAFDIILDGGDLTEPNILPFTFRTEDYIVSADDELITPEILSQNYPNPFNPSTTISYNLSTEELVNASISIYNAKGQLVRTFNDLNSNGNIIWDGRDYNNNIVNSGVYFYKLNCIKTSKIRKMILIK